MSRRESMYFLINKPFGFLSQFTAEGSNPGLGDLYDLPKDVYPVGRLDLDSEGLLILTNDRSFNQALLNPKNEHKRTYWVEVDGIPQKDAIDALKNGVEINLKGKKHKTLPAGIKVIDPKLDERSVPVNRKKHPLTSWLAITLTEGKNRQVRRMTAKVGHPTLRLIRVSIEGAELGNLESGGIVQVSGKVLKRKLGL